MPDCLSLATWLRISSRKGLAMSPASIFLAPGAQVDWSVVLVAMVLVLDWCLVLVEFVGDVQTMLLLVLPSRAVPLSYTALNSYC